MSSILLIEDHMVFAKALIRFLTAKAGLEVIETIQSGEDALKKLPHLNVDLVLVDVSLPNMNGIDLVRKIHERYPALRCLMLSGHLSPQYLKRALDAGARGYILKDDVSGIMEGVQEVLNGQIYVSQSLRENS